MADRATITVDVKIPALPELGAEMFARLDSEQQARMLSMMWRQMADQYGGDYKASLQCAYVRDDLDEDAKRLLQELAPLDNEGRELFALEVDEPSRNERMGAQRHGFTLRHYEETEYGVRPSGEPDLHAQFEISDMLLHHDRSAGDIIEHHYRDLGRDLGEKLIKLAREKRDTARRADKTRRLAEGYGMGAEKFKKACAHVFQPGDTVCMDKDGNAVPAGGGNSIIGTALNEPDKDGNVDVVVHGGTGFGGSTSIRMPTKDVNDPRLSEIGASFLPPEEFVSDKVFQTNPCGEIPLGKTTMDTCDECKGTGEYRGFTNVEPCGKCGGSGKL